MLREYLYAALLLLQLVLYIAKKSIHGFFCKPKFEKNYEIKI